MDPEYHEWITSYIDEDGNNINKKIVWYGWSCKQTKTMTTYHRDDGPAYLIYVNDKLVYSVYMINSERHRIYGLAIICTNSSVVKFGKNAPFEHYYLFNKRVAKEDFYTPGFIDSFILEHS